ncbi:hypothetical protein [Nostoc sp.]|uniref:hypothetical protein n=1 Tax=Nostoc sp. TaxID=1180 RepID=UPI002FF59AA5
MADHHNSVTLDFELNLIKNDAGFYLELITELSKQKSVNLFIWGILPYLSLFTIETSQYIENKFPIYANPMSKEYSQIIRVSRMRIKFFDDTLNKVSGMFELLDWISDFHEEWYINSHKGSFSSLKRALQLDLGIFAYDGHIIGSTHTGLLFTGLAKKNLSEINTDVTASLEKLLFSISKELGSYLAMLSNLTEFTPIKTNSFDYRIQENQLGYKDVNSAEFFSLVFNGSDTISINFSLLLFLSTTNFIRHVMTKLVSGLPDTLFKLKFITLYHLASSLKKLHNYCYPENVFTEHSKKYFQSVINNNEFKKITSKKILRNILVHYQVQDLSDILLCNELNLKDLVEYFFDGEKFEKIDEQVDFQIARISEILEQWLNWSVKPNQFSRW